MTVLGIIRTVGTPMKAVLEDGTIVERKDFIFVPENAEFIPLVPDPDHFVYENHKMYENAYMCTCGAPAVIALPPFPKKWTTALESEQRPMFMCLAYMNYDRHVTSFVNKDEFGKEKQVYVEERGKSKKY